MLVVSLQLGCLASLSPGFSHLQNKDENASLTGFGQECHSIFFLLEYGKHIMYLIILSRLMRVILRQGEPLKNLSREFLGTYI